jgi:hypothetical protein
MPRFYVHVKDVQFAGPNTGPWEGERRIGPFDTEADANAQAAAEAENGLEVTVMTATESWNSRSVTDEEEA